MSERAEPEREGALAGSAFDAVAAPYARRPSYPEELARWLQRQLGPDPWLLDVGCGPGTLTCVLAGAMRRCLGVDVSAPMLQALRATGAGRGLLQAEGEALPIRSQVIDAVVFSQSLHWMDPARALAEARRVLVPGGLLVLCWQSWMGESAPLEQVWDTAWREVRGRPADRAGRPPMDTMEQRVGAPASARFQRTLALRMSPAQQVDFLSSRAACGRVEPAARERLHAAFRRGCARLGPIDYELQVEARAWSRQSLPRQGPAGAAT